MGISTPTVVLNKSYVPYCSVVNTAVYNGTKKKDINFVAKLLKVNNPIFLKRYL